MTEDCRSSNRGSIPLGIVKKGNEMSNNGNKPTDETPIFPNLGKELGVWSAGFKVKDVIAQAKKEIEEEGFRMMVKEQKEIIKERMARSWWRKVFPWRIIIVNINERRKHD